MKLAPADDFAVDRHSTTIHRTAATIILIILFLVPLSGCNSASDAEQARALQETGRFKQSLAPLGRALETAPDDSELHYLNGLALVQTSAHTQSVWSLRKAMEDPEWLQKAGLLLASAGLRAQNYELGLEAIDAVLAEHPDDADALLMQANLMIALRSRFEEALESVERVLDQEPDRREARVVRLIALLGLERAEEAGEALADMDFSADDESLDPKLAAQFCAARSVFAKEKGDLEAAEESFAGCLEEFPVDSQVVDTALEFYDESGNGDQSILILEKVIEEQPLALSYRSALAARLRVAGRASDAEKLLLEATALHENAPDAVWVEVARHHAALEDFQAMATAYERAVEVSRAPSPELRFVAADALLLAERLDDALVVGESLPLPAHRDLIVGRVLYERRELKEALARIEASLRLWPENAGARYYAALAAERLGDFDRAIDEYRYSIRAGASQTDGRYRLALLHEAEGRYELAVAAAQSAGARESIDPEAVLVGIRAASGGGLQDRVKGLVASLKGLDDLQVRGLAALAEGTRRWQGAQAAAELLGKAQNLNLSHPANAELLRALVVYQGATGNQGPTGKSRRASAAIAAALKRHPEVADFHEIRGVRLELEEAPEADVRAAFERALEIDAAHERALLGLARIEDTNGRVEEALALIGRAADGSPESGEPRGLKAQLLIEAARPAEAESALEELLHLDPYDGSAAASLVALLRERGVVDDRTAELQSRATRFDRSRKLKRERKSRDSDQTG